MALTNESNGFSMNMPVAPAYGYGYGGSGGLGNMFGGDGWWILLLFILLGGGAWGNGFGGGFGADGLYPWMNNSQNINSGFRDQALQTSLAGLQNSVTSGFGDVQTALCGGFAGVNAGIANGFAQAEIANNARQIANMQQAFAAQTAMGQGFNGLQSQLAQCCCDNRMATADTKYALATEACATRTANAENTNALLNALNGGIQSIKDQLCSDKIEAKNDLIAQLRSELMYARGQASQDVQTAAIQAGQRALANEVEQYVAPRPIPSYYVQNPNCCGNYTACGAAA